MQAEKAEAIIDRFADWHEAGQDAALLDAVAATGEDWRTLPHAALGYAAAAAIRLNQHRIASRHIKFLTLFDSDGTAVGPAQSAARTLPAGHRFLRQIGQDIRSLRPLRGKAAGWPGQQDPIIVLGSSFSRCFGFLADFLPLMLGSGRTTYTLADDVFANLLARLDHVLPWLPSSAPVILAFGAEPRLTQQARSGEAPEFAAMVGRYSDDVLSQLSVERYRQIVERVRAHCRNQILILGHLPTFDSAVWALTTRMNADLAAAAKGWNVDFLDLAEQFSNGDGCLRPELSASPEDKDAHFNQAGLELVADALTARGLLPAERGMPYVWAQMFQLPLPDGLEPARLWCWPQRALTADIAIRSKLAELVADLLVAQHFLHPASGVTILNSFEGLIPYCLFTGRPLRIRAVPLGTTEQTIALRTLALTGRDDIILAREPSWGPGEDTLVWLDPTGRNQTELERLLTCGPTGPERLFLAGPTAAVAKMVALCGRVVQEHIPLGSGLFPPLWQDFGFWTTTSPGGPA